MGRKQLSYNRRISLKVSEEMDADIQKLLPKGETVNGLIRGLIKDWIAKKKKPDKEEDFLS